MKKIFAIALAALGMVALQAQDRKVGDTFGDGFMNFTVISLDPAEVEVAKSPNASGFIDIPTEIVDYGITYKVTKIGKMAFCDNTDHHADIEGVNIPEGIVEIGAQAFIGCYNIQKLHFPSTLKSIGSSAFYCYSEYKSILDTAICDAVVPPKCGDYVFGRRLNGKNQGYERDIPLIVPEGSVQAYRDAEGWEYFNIISDGKDSSVVEEVFVPIDIDGTPIDGSGSGDNSGNNNQGVEEVNIQPAATSRKYFEHGQLIIEKNGVKFNVLGSKL